MKKGKRVLFIAILVVTLAAEILVANTYAHSERLSFQQGICLIRGTHGKKGNQFIDTLIKNLFRHRKN